MLTHINISNFAIIDELELDFASGFTVLTGETGAGKSIIVDALNMALGERADSQVIRAGADKTEVALTFDISKLPLALQWLDDNDLGMDGECLIRRVITQEGRSRAYINGSAAPLQQLRDLGGLLVEIHGQHEHQTLLSRDNQLKLLDHYAGLTDTTQQLAAIARQWHQHHAALEETKASLHEKRARSDYLQFQLSELHDLALQPGEYAQLEEEHQRLASAEKLITATEQAINVLDDDDQSLTHALNQQLSELEKLCRIDSRLREALELIDSAALQLSEGSKALRQYLKHLDLEPQRLQWVEERIGAIHDVARKHHIDAEELITLQQRLQEEFDSLAYSDEHIARLEQQLHTLREQYDALAEKLSAARQQGSTTLSAQIETIIRQLGLPNGKFTIQLSPVTDKELPSKGRERIDFLVSANPGQPAGLLSKVASGGELSRISLAIQVIAANNSENMTFVFDEVDTGIGGGTAETVGQQLARLGKHHQVFCVTHLAQVAAQGHQHFSVSKSSDGHTTQTTIKGLQDRSRIEEIARMLGGIEITEQTRNHAAEMLQRFAQAPTKSKSSRRTA